jgi:hypothetical protein
MSFMKHLIYTVYMDLRETIYYCVILTMYVIKRYDIAVFSMRALFTLTFINMASLIQKCVLMYANI